MKKKKLVVILGQTATGKTSLSIDLAKKYNGEIISADSRQIYKDLNLGSGKITPDEMSGINHYLLDVSPVEHIFTVFEYQEQAKKALHTIQKKEKLAIICGGTGMYIDSLVYDQKFPGVPANEQLRSRLDKLSTSELLERLGGLDTKWITSIDAHNRPRIIRAIEILESGGKRPRLSKRSPYDVLFIGLKVEKEILHNQIYNRLLERIDQGMINEVQGLLDMGISYERLYALGLEYRYISLYLRGDISYDEMIEVLFTEIKKFAKRQMTWFKRNKNIQWFHPDQSREVFDEIDRFLKK